ncbi:hypothetical protein ACHAWF_009675 [Thalassiosira exigua]
MTMMRKTVSLLCISASIGGACAFAPPRTTTPSSKRTVVLSSTAIASEVPDATAATAATGSDGPGNGGGKNTPAWEVKQHLYGLDMVQDSESSNDGMSVTVGADGEEVGGDGGEGLPLPQTYITCGKCKSLFAIAEADLGERGKGCRVKCSVCGNSWYQSRDRLFDIPTSTHDLLPAQKSGLDRIARNLARDQSPNFFGVGKLYVGNLDWTTTADNLLEIFEANTQTDGEKVGVCDVSVVTGPDGRSRGFAFVSFYDEADGKAALACDGLECNGRPMSVREPNN